MIIDAQEGLPCAAHPNLRILTLTGERVNAGAVNLKALKVRPQRKNEPPHSVKRCAAAVSLKITAKIFAFAKRFA